MAPRGERYDEAPRGGYEGRGGGSSGGGYESRGGGGGGGDQYSSDAPESDKLYVGNLSYDVRCRFFSSRKSRLA